MATEPPVGYTLTWEKVNCRLKSGGFLGMGEQKVVHSLVDATGFARPGESLAILGASGAGKTTLVDILSQRKSLGQITGEVLVNGQKPDAFFKKRLGQITTMMAHIPTMTVRETLMFAAECRMPRNSTKEERIARVDEVIAGLKLTNAQNTPVGDELIRGVSSGEKKRTEVGTEMIARPRMLFLDEPTSGLDDFGARFTMELVLKYVKSENVCVIIVIHQPSEAVFKLFDNALILAEGRTCYFGPVAAIESYFSTMGYPTPKLQNPIEHYLDVVQANAMAAAEYYDKSPLNSANVAEVERLKAQSYSPVRYSEHIVERPWWDQIKLVGARCLLRYWRNPSTSWGRSIMFLILALLFGGLFYKLTNDISGLRNTLSVCTSFGFLAIFVSGAAVPQFLEDRELYLQELDTAFYSTPPYWITYLLIEGMFTLVINTLQVIIIYFMAGLPTSAFGAIYPMLLLQAFLAVAVVQAWSSWSKTLVQAFTALWASGLVFYAFSGAQAPLADVSNGLRWIADINHWRWCSQFVIWNVMKDQYIECPTTGSTVFTVPVSGGFIQAMNATFVADPSNAVGVSTFWQGVQGMTASLLLNRIPGITPETIAAGQANALAIANAIAPLSRAGANFTNPAVFTQALGGGSVRSNASAVFSQSLANPTAFSPAFYCPTGQIREFLNNTAGLTPSNPATTNVAYGVNVALFTFYALMTLAGLMFSRNYRRR